MAAACIGNILEWYDFAVFGSFAPEIGQKFFPPGDPTVSMQCENSHDFVTNGLDGNEISTMLLYCRCLGSVHVYFAVGATY